MSIKDKYVDLYKEHHRKHKRYGNSYAKQHQIIEKLIKKTNSKTLLDYGCGKGTQYTVKNLHKAWGFMPDLYDPAIENFSILPDKMYDGIYSTDVMEHIPEEVLPEVFEYIFTHSNKFVFLGISTSLAKAILPNGENAHCTVQTLDWWEEKINSIVEVKTPTWIRTYGKKCNRIKQIW